MRRGLIAVLVASFPAVAAEPAYSAAYARCMNDAGSTAAIVECTSAEFTRQDARLNAAYRTLQQALPKARRASLTRAQRAWIAFKDAECAFVLDPDGGSAARIAANQCVLRLTAERADQLDDHLRDTAPDR